METGIGATLRDARNRRKIDLSEVEAATKIRLRYLRAIENDEWDVLPGSAYTRSFIRTYASYLGLDGDRLADEYRRQSGEVPPGERLPRPEPVVASGQFRGGGPILSRGAWAAIVTFALIAVLVVVGLSGGDEDGSPGRAASAKPGKKHQAQQGTSQAQEIKSSVSVRLAANAEVWVCLLDADGQALVNGQILTAGAEEGPFRSDSFTVSFGNGEVSMQVDGQQASIPETASPIGYSIDGDGELTQLSEAERPTCT